MSFADTAKEVNVQIENITPQEPRIYWRNGKLVKDGSKVILNRPGLFYVAADHLKQTPGEPWETSGLYDEDGYQAESLSLAIIGYRQQPVMIDRSGDQVQYVWLSEWQPGAQFYSEVLCLVSGIEEPVVWVLKGSAGKEVLGKGGLLQTFRKDVVREGERVAGQKLPDFTFWLRIVTQRDAKGNVVHRDTGYGTTTTPPTLTLPDTITPEVLEEMFIGDELFRRAAAVYQEYKDSGWFDERRGNEPQEQAPQAQSNGNGHSNGETPTLKNQPKEVLSGVAQDVAMRTTANGIPLLTFKIHSATGNSKVVVWRDKAQEVHGWLTEGEHVEVTGKWKDNTYKGETYREFHADSVAAVEYAEDEIGF
jgi:hypothetical protein